MTTFSRRDFCRSVGAGALLSQAQPKLTTVPGRTNPDEWSWARSCRAVIAETYNPPFYPSFDYRAEKAVAVVKALHGDTLRYPAASYFAYFPTRTDYPVHPEIRSGQDPMRETVDLCHKAGLTVIAYIPLNHPFMEVRAGNPLYDGWIKRFENGKPMTTEHYGYTPYYEGCLNSPLREEIRQLVREVVGGYEIDAAYFDGPYMGMRHARRFCYCKHCREAYRKARNKALPPEDGLRNREEEIEYTLWLRDEVVIAFLAEISEMIRKERNIPVLFNDTSLLSSREWRSRAIPVVDGFMFEAAETPEQKLFNLGLGHSTGKLIWTYVGTHTQYNREHMKNERVRGWFSYPVESEELLLDGATALAGHAGLKYWGLSRFFYMKQDPSAYQAGRHVQSVFDFAGRHSELLFQARSQPFAGLLVGSQTIDWFNGKVFVPEAYKNAFYGAFQLLKELSYDCEPFLDYRLTPELLTRYKLLYIPNAPCLSRDQCEAIRRFVDSGGTLIATHLTSAADEFSRRRPDFGLADVLGCHLQAEEPVEIPDLYLFPAGWSEAFPQDPQVVRFEAVDPATVIALTIDRGHRRTLGPAVVQKTFGRGRSIYIGSSLEAVYEETRMAVIRDYLASLLDPLIGRFRHYQVAPRPGLLAHYSVSGNSLLLHLLANTGNKWKKLRQREKYLPLADVKARIRVPAGRTVKRVGLLRADRDADYSLKGDWLEVHLAEVNVHELIQVELA
ncbi:MAG: beta-galactosidase trimerization domain-containing protein [Acidobacteriota bacterium]